MPPTIFTVNSLGDAGTGSGDAGDLRYCINQANSDDQANQIFFDPNLFSAPQTITLLGTQLWLEDTGGTQTITGPAVGVTITAALNGTVFQVEPGVTTSISSVTISGGAAKDYAYSCLRNNGTATLTDCTISGGAAGNIDGGLANDGTATLTDCTISGTAGGVNNISYANLTMTDCTVSGNNARSGGALFNAGTATLTACTLSDNTASESGGAVITFGTAYLTDCTVSGNSAVWGGGVDNSGTAYLTDCTVSGNYATYDGGGASNYGTATLTGCTLSGNSGGGLSNYSSDGTAILTDTIVAGNTGADIGGPVSVSGSYNLIGTGGSGGLIDGVDGNIVLTSLTALGLAALGNNGGPTQTMALLAGSPAIAAGVIADYPGTTTPITTDQRGEPLDTPNPDIGAFQTQGSGLIGLTFSGLSNQSITYGTPSVTISGTLSSGSQAPKGESVTMTLGGVQQSATIGSGGAFSTTFDTSGLTVVKSPYTISYAYAGDGTFASASTTSTLTVEPTLVTFTVDSLGDAGSGSGFAGDLRYCINQANADDMANTIVFDPTLFSTPQTITLSGGQLELEGTSGRRRLPARPRA